MIKRIAVGSLRNKLLFILPAALVLSEFLEWLLTPILMLGGVYLCYEGAEKLWECSPRTPTREAAAGAEAPAHEDELVGGAIRTDFILSAEIMVISLNEVADEPLLSRALILVVVAFAITAGVYGAVALIVKMDDVGLRLAQARAGAAASFGRGWSRHAGRPVGALEGRDRRMLWVGGHILLVGLDELGLPGPTTPSITPSERRSADALGGRVRRRRLADSNRRLSGLGLGRQVPRGGVMHRSVRSAGPPRARPAGPGARAARRSCRPGPAPTSMTATATFGARAGREGDEPRVGVLRVLRAARGRAQLGGAGLAGDLDAGHGGGRAGPAAHDREHHVAHLARRRAATPRACG